MTGKDDFEALMRLADFHFKTWDSRRQSEQWKLTFGLWGLLIASMTFLPPSINGLEFFVGGVVVTVPYCFWLLGLLKSNRLDREREQAARLSAVHYVRASFDKELLEQYESSEGELSKARLKQRRTIGLWTHWAVWPVLLVTVLLIGAGAWVVHAKHEAAKQALAIGSRLESLDSRAAAVEVRLQVLERSVSSVPAVNARGPQLKRRAQSSAK